MSVTVGDFLVGRRLHAWGVRVLFGYPSDGINGVFRALNRAKGKIEFIQARHEEMAAFIASAYAKFTGELGVCIATSGPGASHLITGLYDARLDHKPVLAIAGQPGEPTTCNLGKLSARLPDNVILTSDSGSCDRVRGSMVKSPARQLCSLHFWAPQRCPRLTPQTARNQLSQFEYVSRI